MEGIQGKPSKSREVNEDECESRKRYDLKSLEEDVDPVLAWKSADLLEQNSGKLVYRSLAVHDGWERIDTSMKAVDTRSGDSFKAAKPSPNVEGQRRSNVLANEVEKLIFDIKDYPVAQYHKFTSLEAPELLSSLQKALNALEIVFEPVYEGSSRFKCQAVADCASANFTLNLSELKPKCQGMIGHKYVIEVRRTRCSCPNLWAGVCRSIFAELGKSCTAAQLSSEMPAPDMPLPTASLSAVRNIAPDLGSDDAATACLGDRQSKALINVFLDMVSSRQCSRDAIEYAEAFGSLYATMRVDHDQSNASVSITVDQLSSLKYLLCHNDHDVRRCTCTILHSLLHHGLLTNLDITEKENLFKGLLRVVNMVNEESVLLSPLQSEALRALQEMSSAFKPDGVLAKQARQTFDRCAMSANTKVSTYATGCLAQFFV